MRLVDIAVALPESSVDSDEVARWSGASPVFARTKIGVGKRHWLKEEAALDLAAAAGHRLLAANQALERRSIDLLIFVGQATDQRIPHRSALLQQQLGLSSHCMAFDLGLACSGWVYALSVAKALMVADGFRDALIVTCDPYSRLMARADSHPLLFGDAATATWLSRERGAVIGRANHGTDGSGGAGLETRRTAGATGVWGQALAEALFMDGRAIFNFMMERVPRSLEACLAANDLSVDEIDFFVFHQASAFLLESLIEELGIDPAKCPIGLAETGNTVSSSIPLTMAPLLRAGEMAGKRVCVSGFGAGLSWATNILTFGASV